MKLRYSPRAIQDLTAIYLYLVERTPVGSRNVLIAIHDAIEFIKQNPNAAEMTTNPDIRAKVVQRYPLRIFYRVVGDTIEIAHVRHTSRTPWSGDD